MIESILKFSIKNKLIIGLFVLAIIVGGIWSLSKIPLDAVPDITNNQVQIITQAPTLGTEDIEKFVSYPIEVAMANLPGVTEIRSISRFGLSLVTIVFEDDLGTYLPRQLVAEKLNEVKNEIPAGFGEPKIGPISTGLGEIYQYTLEVDSNYINQYTSTDLRTIQDWIIKRQMAMVPGVIEVNGFGGFVKQFEVAVNPNQLKAMNISLPEVFNALSLNNENTGGAYIEKNHFAYFIRGEGLYRNLDDIRNTVITNKNNIPILIKDVADVKFGSAVRYGAFTKNGQGEAVGGMIMMLKGANSNKVIQDVKNQMAEIEKSLPEGVSIHPFLDRSKLIEKTTSTVTENLLLGALIVIFVLVFLLGNWRGGLIVASTIPLSLLFAFILMNVFDVWANLMSLGAIDFGIIVDGAVIIVEGTVFIMHQQIIKSGFLNQEKRDKIALKASSKMMNSAFFGQLIILIVFIPILALQGVEGKMFKPMALTFMFAMIGVMILCLTYVPMISALFIRVKQNEKKSWGDHIVTWLEKKYGQLLSLALAKSKWLIGFSVIIFGLSIFTYTRLGGEFIPQLDEGDLAFHIILKPGSSLSEAVAASTKIEKMLMEEIPEILSIYSRFGVADVPTDPMPMDVGDSFVILKPQDEWETFKTKDELIEKISNLVNTVPGINTEFSQPIEMRFNELITGVREDIAIKVFGEDLEVLAAKADELSKIIAPIEGVADLKVEATTGLPQIQVKYNKSKVAQYGLNIQSLNNTITTAFAGAKAGFVFEGEKRFDLVLRMQQQNRQNITDIQQLFVELPNGTQIPIKEVAEISYQPGPMQISRENTNRRVYVGINVRGRDIETLVNEIKQKLDAQFQLPAGYYIKYGGAFENLERAAKRLKIVVPIALLLIFVLIFFALQSFKQTFMIYIAIPMAAIGGVFSLWLRDMPFSISAGVGFIVLFGVAVLNGLVLVSGWNELKEQGENNINARIKLGAKRRVRPILLTALTDVLGFLPMAVSTSAGAEVQQPLATVVIGGMISASLLTLFVLPILYRWFENNNLKLKPIGVNKLALVALVLVIPSLGSTQNTQPKAIITLEEALQKAAQNLPQLKAAQLNIQSKKALKNTAWDFGSTQIFTGAEEMINQTGVITPIGIQQQNIDVFAVGAKRNQQKSQIDMAESMLDLTELELNFKVKQSYGKLFSTLKQRLLFDVLDSIFTDVEKNAFAKYQAEDISKLEYLATLNQSQNIGLRKIQAIADYNMALQQFNFWLQSDTLFELSEQNLNELLAPPTMQNNSQHPLIISAQQEVQQAKSEVKVTQSSLYPKLNVQYGPQQIAGVNGYYQYQAGITVPLFFMKDQALVKSAKINHQIAEQNLAQTQIEVNNEVKLAEENFKKWNQSWQFYQNNILPNAQEQRNGALLAYKLGAINYTEFLQNVNVALQTEISAWQTFEQFLISKYKLEFFLNQ